MTTVSMFAAARRGKASYWSAHDTTPLGLPGAHGSGDSFAIVAPSDGEASLCFAYDTPPLGLPRAHESGVSFAIRSSQECPQIGTRPQTAQKGPLEGREMVRKRWIMGVWEEDEPGTMVIHWVRRRPGRAQI